MSLTDPVFLNAVVAGFAALGAVVGSLSAYCGFLSFLVDPDSLDDVGRSVNLGIAVSFPAGVAVGAAVFIASWKG